MNDNVYQNTQPCITETRCPVKEIITLVLGIYSLMSGVVAACTFWHPVLATVFFILGIGYGIPAMILFKKIQEQATLITNKAYVGKKLALAGIICSCAAFVLMLILWFLAISGLFTIAILENLGTNGGY